MKATPLYDRVLVKRDDPEKKTAAGIHIPEYSEERPMMATVVKVGEGRIDDHGIRPLRVKSGDRVVTGKYAGTEIVIDGETYWIIREDDILLLLDSEKR